MKTTRVIRKPQKKQKLKEEKEIDGNRNSKSLGNLPEEILRQILSFLPTKDAVRTSVVCKRWEYLWARIPNLDFAQHEPAKALCKSKRTVFMKFVDRALRLRDSSVIRRFALRYTVQSDASRVDRWISTAVRHNVQELYIVLDSFKGEFSLPYCLFTCATLTSLHLDMPNFLKLPTAICFSNLKILAIERVTFSDEYLTQQFFSGLLLLEKLELHQCSWGDLKVVRISAPKLHSLSICEFDRRNSIYGNDCEVMIFGVCLEEFNYKGFLFSDYCLYESFSLKKADIYIYHDNPSVEIVDRTNKLLSGLTNVEFLKFYSGVFKVRMYAAKFLTHMPMFHNLMTLVFDGTSLVLDFEALLNILQRFPCLENLEILGGISLSSNCEEDDRILTPCFLSHLKCIKVGRYHGDKEELSVVKILLKNSLVLEEIAITCPGYFTWNLKKQESFYKQLIELPKGSQNCKIVLK